MADQVEPVSALIHEPASIITLLGVLVLSIALDFGWKRVRDSRASGGMTNDVQVGH
jgi:hypothetical protein